MALMDTTGIAMVQRAANGQTVEVRFVRPVISTILACSRITRGTSPTVAFGNEALEYAQHSGLAQAIAGNYSAMVRPHGGTEGRTWSHLTTLYQHAEIEACNRTINDLLFNQLASVSRSVVDAIARVIGELHDNVASHSNGRGFSCAQFYPGHLGYTDRLELSVADAGCGFLHNVRRVVPAISTDAEAIEWCLQKGNTAWCDPKSMSETSGWGDPYAESAEHSGQSDHHMGWGLWLLNELITMTQSTMWIWTGDASYTVHDGTSSMKRTPIRWPGVLIDVAVYPDLASRVNFAPFTARLEQLAGEIGL